MTRARPLPAGPRPCGDTITFGGNHVLCCELDEGHRKPHCETTFRVEDEAFVTVEWPRVVKPKRKR